MNISWRSFDASEAMLDSIVWLYALCWNAQNIADIKNRLIKHTGYEGFRGIIAVNHTNNQLVGFTYGYTTKPGQFYREKLAAHLREHEVEKWLTDGFEFVELAVHPDFRNSGIGSQLHDKLLSDLPHDTAVLTTGDDNIPAQLLYQQKGWKTIKSSAEVMAGSEPLTIMGKFI